ncbi:hypothetical protein BRC81_00950 [Halobacteriales archaeon QS_1_68_20]|nr:MAG: hypothetical protein BRC81_00950 [Halobacteriales archaeon QS_1_68_20]
MGTEALTAEVVDGVVVVEWHEHRPDREVVNQRVLDLLEREDVDAYVAVDRTDRYLGPETQEAMHRMASAIADCGVERVGLVGDEIKALAAKRVFDEAGMTVESAQNRADAVEWARSGA